MSNTTANQVVTVLTSGSDVVLPSDADQEVRGTAATLTLGTASYDYSTSPAKVIYTGGDQLDGGAGYDVLALTGSGNFDLSRLSQFTGFEEVRLTNATASQASLTLRDGVDLTVTLSDGTPPSTSTYPYPYSSAGSTAVALGTGLVTLHGGNEGDSISAYTPSRLHAGDVIDGGAGYDTLSLSYDSTPLTPGTTTYDPKTGASIYTPATYQNSVYDLTKISLSHVESLNAVGNISASSYNNNANVIVKVDTASLADVTSITLNYGATLTTEAGNLDLTGKSIYGYSGGGKIVSTNATGTAFTVDSVATGLQVLGGAGQDTLVVKGLTLTQAQRDQAFAGSIETITDATATYTKAGGVNYAPIAKADTATTSGGSATTDAAHGVLANDTDAEGDVLTVYAVKGKAADVGQAVHGTYGDLTLNADGSYSYTVTSAPTLPAHDVFAYTIIDGHGGGSTASLDITVTGGLPKPAAPTLALSSLGGTSSGAAPTIAGTTLPGATVTLYDGAAVLSSVASNTTTGAFSILPPVLGAGEHVLSAKASNAGGTSAASSSVVIEVGTAATVVLKLDAYQATSGLAGIWLTDTSVLAVDSVDRMRHLIKDDAGALAAIKGGFSFAVTSVAGTTTTTSTYDAAGMFTSSFSVTFAGGQVTGETTTFADGSKYVSVFQNGVVTSETHFKADKSKDVDLFGITGKSYVTEHDHYSAAGQFTGFERMHADNSFDFTYARRGDGSVVTKQYDGAGVITGSTIAFANGDREVLFYKNGILASDTLTHADGGKTVGLHDAAGVVTTETTTNADSSKVVINYQGGVPASETRVNADQTRDVTLYGITDKSYVTEHDHYSAGGQFMSFERMHADGTFDFTYEIRANGIKVATQYDAAGHLSSVTTSVGDGSKDMLFYKAGALVSETQTHADATKDVYLFAKDQIIGHDAIDANGTLLFADRINGNGSHTQTAYVSGIALTSSTSVSDSFQTSAGGGNIFRFAPMSGKDTIVGFHAGAGADHDTLEIAGQGKVSDFTAWAGAHLSQAGSDVAVSLNAADSVLLKSVALSSLTTHDFLFV